MLIVDAGACLVRGCVCSCLHNRSVFLCVFFVARLLSRCRLSGSIGRVNRVCNSFDIRVVSPPQLLIVVVGRTIVEFSAEKGDPQIGRIRPLLSRWLLRMFFYPSGYSINQIIMNDDLGKGELGGRRRHRGCFTRGRIDLLSEFSAPTTSLTFTTAPKYSPSLLERPPGPSSQSRVR